MKIQGKNMSVLSGDLGRCACVAFAVLLVGQPAWAGKLSQLEEDLEKPSSEQENGRESPCEQCDGDTNCDEDDHSGESLLAEVILLALASGGVASVERVSETTPREGSLLQLRRRRAGEALLPAMRLDATGAWLLRDIGALHLRGELGWGPVAITANWTRMHEEGDRLDILNEHLVYRMALWSFGELDLALGAGQSAGAKTTWGFSLGIPIRIHPSQHFGVEFTPTWTVFRGSLLQDYHLALVGGTGFVSATVGFRMLRSDNVKMQGPTVGVALRY